MIDTIKILDQLLKKIKRSNNEIYNSLPNVSEEEFKKKLEELNLLENRKRYLFFWQLQLCVEECLIKSGVLETNERIAELVVNEWNKTQERKIDTFLVMNFLQTLNYNYSNSKKAFMAICDGDLESYKIFSKNPILFKNLLARFFICMYEKDTYPLMLNTINQLLSYSFDNQKPLSIRETFTLPGFIFKNKLDERRLFTYKKDIGLEQLVFLEGIKTILVNLLDEIEETEELSLLKQKLVKITQPNVIEETNLLDHLFEELEEVNQPNIKINKEETTPIEVKQNLELEENNSITIQEKSYLKKEQPNEIVTDLEQVIVTIQNAIDNINKKSKLENSLSVDQSQQKLKLAEEEINRLKLALQQEKEKVILAEEKAYSKIIQAIGGESSNYLLSDLYEESQGTAPYNESKSRGKLINLFSYLGVAIDLEEYSNNQEINSVFTINKEELIKNYRIDVPISSSEEFIKVKLLKYGWLINGKVVVPPLVTEIKEEM